MKKLKKMSFKAKKRIFLATLIFLALILSVTTFFTTYSEYVSNPNNNASGVVGNTVYVNDSEADWYYYASQNYTSNNGTLPTIDDKNIYNNNTLVETQITYDGTDNLYNATGYVSLTEQQNKYVYYKYFPVNNNGTTSLADDYILIDLIDNPFTNRPNDLGFNGWTTSYRGVTISYDATYYERYAKVPITYNNNIPSSVNIVFNANWVTAAVGTLTNSWYDAFNNLNVAGMKSITVYSTTYNYDMTGYYTSAAVTYYDYCDGYYNSSGVLQSGYCCNDYYNGCTLYTSEAGNNYDPTKSYYELVNGSMTAFDASTLQITPTSSFTSPFTSTTNMSGYYKQVTINYGDSLTGYYDSDGNSLTGTCSSSQCTYYELIQYYDSSNNPSVVDTSLQYYYLVTRDTNIINMTSNISTSWSSSNNKPFTLTSLHNGVQSNVTWTVSGRNVYVHCYNDTRIENLTISATSYYATNNSPSSSSNARRFFYGNFHNVKLGRGIAKSGSYANFLTVLGGNNQSTSSGSSSNLVKYKFEVESGFYSTLSLTNTSNANSSHYDIYIAAKGVYGNDYDRVTNNNDNLDLYYCACGSWNDNYYSSTNTAIMFDLTIKSGKYGSGKYDYTTGIYVGGRMGGTHYAAKKIKVEGGYIFNLIGGPLTDSSQQPYNDSYIYITGGSVDMITGGAGETATYGNRIIQITGGTVNYSVFGGSNGYQSSEGNGTVNGSSYIYIGGTATIGDSNNLSNTLYGSEAGSVFGIGNGRSGYSSIGSNDNSYIVVADEATINRNVYGGGNFGATGVSSPAAATTYIKILGGTIEDSVYGGGNNNGAGNSASRADITISMSDGLVKGSVYGGSNEKGTVYGTTTVNINGGSVTGNVYGGGRGGYVSSSNTGTFVTENVNVTVGNSALAITPIITGSVYGGSAYGTVNGSTQTTDIASYNTNVVVNKGTITNVYGGGQGDATYTPYVCGNVTVNINGGTITDVYGGNDLAGSPNGTVTVNLNNGTITDSLYGGGNQAGVNITHVNLNGGTSVNVYGGSDEASATTTNVILQGSNITGNLYGGSNLSGNVTTTNVTANSGTANTIFGGNNAGGIVTTTNVNVNGANVNTVYGGGKNANCNTTNVTLASSNTITAVYGGGESADVTSQANVTLTSGNVTTIYGGSNQSGTVQASLMTLVSGTTTNIYGGNNAGGTTLTTTINANGGTSTAIHGGGNLASTTTTNVNLNGITATNVYGGGESADVTSQANVNLTNGSITTIYGGSNQSGTVNISNIITTGGTVATIYGGNNLGGTTNTANINANGGNITSTLYGGGKLASTGITKVTIQTTPNIPNVYGGGESADVTTSTVTLNTSNVGNLYGGSNQSGTVNTSNIIVNGASTIDTIYGGNNAGGTTLTANLDINGGTIGHIYGGGNQAVTGKTISDINGATVTGDVYGGGNQAGITTTTALDIINSTVNGTVYGGGNLGQVGTDTSVYISSSNIGNSVYAGGNGVTATVNGSTTLNIDGTSYITGHAFGGGNQAETGTELNNNSTTNINIVGGTITGNVYGGANTSRLYGIANVKIGQNAVNNNSLTTGDILINGTVFGGGEANASGSAIYDWDFISVTEGINIDIDASSHTNFLINGSIFGSGNASSTNGYSYINIKNYGTLANPKKNISIQRATSITLDNSAIELSGAADRANLEFSSTLFSMTRIDLLKLKNNSTLYLQKGFFYVDAFSSMVDVNGAETLATVDINDTTGTVTKNVDNRLYIWEGEVVNIAPDVVGQIYGEVNGMTFFGMYKHDRDGNIATALYDSSYSYGDTVSSNELSYFSNGSYVLGLHKQSHNIKVDGFYSNIENEDNAGHIKTYYINPTPPDTNLYRWIIGELVQSYVIDSLVASKYSTLGAYELPLIDFYAPNTTFTILGFNYDNLDPNVELVDPNTIPRVASTGTIADNTMGLVMETSNTGWMNTGVTTFKTDDNNLVSGTTTYYSENSSVVPTLLFYLYHSKNLETAGDLGSVTISLQVVTPINAIQSSVERVNIVVKINRLLSSTNDYEGTITAGKKYEMFANTRTDVTSDSSISTYFALYAESTNNFYGTGYYHSLVSTLVLPEKTKITMIDYANSSMPEYYYYVVSASDVTTAQTEFDLYGEASYHLSKFIKMGSSSSNNTYSDALANAVYYNEEQGIAEEEFIFIVDYEEANITENHLNLSLLLELRNANNQTLVSVLGNQQNLMKYSLYYNSGASIDVTGTLAKNPIYIGEKVGLTTTTQFIQSTTNGGAIIYDTNYFNQKLGIKVTILNSSGEQINGYDLLGVHLKYNNINYYPRVDGSYRLNLADKVSNVSANLTIDTTNSNLASGEYQIKIESFGSSDGIYYGLVASDYTLVPITVVNAIYGLNISLNEKAMVIDKDTGFTLNNNNSLVFRINYSSALTNPQLRVSLYRRKYEAIYSTDYELVDLKEYVTNDYANTNVNNEYLLLVSPPAQTDIFMYTKPNLVTGTYKLRFSLYDSNSFIGEVSKYIFIK